MRQRIVEFAVARSYGSDSGSWGVREVRVDARNPLHTALEQAAKKAQERFGSWQDVVFIHLYWYEDDEMMLERHQETLFAACTCGLCHEDDGRWFNCDGCNLEAPWCYGAADEDPGLCDDCAVAKRRAEKPPRCRCGKYKHERYKDLTCDKCGTVVDS